VHGRTTIRGIASRVDYSRLGPTFSVRAQTPRGGRTELHKLIDAVRDAEEGWTHPGLTVQAKVRRQQGKDRELLAAAIVRTLEFAEYLAAAGDGGFVERRTRGGARYYEIGWSQLRDAGISVRSFGEEALGQTDGRSGA
jgi:hypothetical protein